MAELYPDPPAGHRPTFEPVAGTVWHLRCECQQLGDAVRGWGRGPCVVIDRPRSKARRSFASTVYRAHLRALGLLDQRVSTT